MFFSGCVAIGLAIFPVLFLLALGDRRRHRDRCTALVGWGYGTFLLWMKIVGLIGWNAKPSVPEELKGKPFIVIANHPSLVDVIFFLNGMRSAGLTCVVKQEWYDSFFFGLVLRSTHYLATGKRDGELAIQKMEDHLRAGHPLMLFPEGTRSRRDKLHRFRGGAFELAKRTGVPILEYFIALDKPTLMKGQPVWDVPDGRAVYGFEHLQSTTPDESFDPREARRLAQDRYRERYELWNAFRGLSSEDHAELPASGESLDHVA